jgi:hypothetical protein
VELVVIESSATFSKCGQYRYALRRRWADCPTVLFVMLNPSTADSEHDDPTIRRCIGFAKSWGYGGLLVANLFSYCTSSPTLLKAANNPIGKKNDEWLRRLHCEAIMTVAAWGNHGRYLDRGLIVREYIRGHYVLGLTNLDEPRHPLYLRSGVRPIRVPS